MKRLLKYLKPFTGFILVAVLLLFVQALADLALPDYMANIVNKGIQRGGICTCCSGCNQEKPDE